jgi:hypothetical protein
LFSGGDLSAGDSVACFASPIFLFLNGQTFSSKTCSLLVQMIKPFLSDDLIVRQLVNNRSPNGGYLFTNWRTIVHQLAND